MFEQTYKGQIKRIGNRYFLVESRRSLEVNDMFTDFEHKKVRVIIQEIEEPIPEVFELAFARG